MNPAKLAEAKTLDVLHSRVRTEGDVVDDEASGYAIGMTAFAAIMMAMGGIWWIMTGIVALANDTFYLVGQEYLFEFDVTTWGWIHLILGIVILLAGAFLFTGAVWARTVGVIVAVLWALAAFAWMPYYPLWGIVLIATSVAVTWALTVHGRDLVDY